MAPADYDDNDVVISGGGAAAADYDNNVVGTGVFIITMISGVRISVASDDDGGGDVSGAAAGSYDHKDVVGAATFDDNDAVGGISMQVLCYWDDSMYWSSYLSVLILMINIST